LLNDSLLARDPRRDFIVAELPGESGGSQEWREVADFADSREEDLHYTLDGQTGEITFGPSLLQPDGGVYRFGAVPAKGARLIMRRYQYGGGTIGNTPRGALSVLKTSIPYVARVNNREPAVGGRDPETLDHAKLQAPKKLRSRTRAVTAEDYELLARDVHGVARTYCLTPGPQPGGPNDPKPGQVVVLVLPAVDDPNVPLTPEQLALPPELNNEVFARLNEQRLIGTTLEVRAPRYLWVAVGITLRLAPRTDPAAMEAARKAGEETLYRYLNPYIGGPHGAGWPIGRDLHRSELFGLLQQIPNVEYADGLRVTVAETGRAVPSVTASQHLVVPFDGLVCSGRHQVRVDYARDEG
jgi:predicted phage baseplate assembly protein